MAITEPETGAAANTPERGAAGWRKWAWFAGLWVGGVAGVTAFAYGVRLLMKLAGMSS